ncbi:MAG: RluA family pseudouridine synthase, partial [Evtepia sp.]
HIQAYLYQKKEWSPYWENSFAPALCNRIDRNTGGIVIAAKNAETLRIMNQKIKDREIEKSYLCVVLGSMNPTEGKLENFLLKDEAKKQVSVHKRPVEGGRTAVTLYRTLAKRNGLSLMECRLITGRTHQIRAQFAAAGHPLLGDGKYGRERENKKWGRTSGQALYSYKLSFPFPTDAGCLEDLRGRTWTVTDVDFVQTYFPGTQVT